MLAACTNIKGSEFIKPGTIYSIGFDGEQVVVNDAGNSYSIDAEGNVSVSYRNGDVKANVPLKLDTTGGVLGMGQENTGYFISEDKTAIVYGFADGKSLPLHVLISNDKGQTWNDYPIMEQWDMKQNLSVSRIKMMVGWSVVLHKELGVR